MYGIIRHYAHWTISFCKRMEENLHIKMLSLLAYGATLEGMNQRQ
jgi:hypothetical protein